MNLSQRYDEKLTAQGLYTVLYGSATDTQESESSALWREALIEDHRSRMNVLHWYAERLQTLARAGNRESFTSQSRSIALKICTTMKDLAKDYHSCASFDYSDHDVRLRASMRFLIGGIELAETGLSIFYDVDLWRNWDFSYIALHVCEAVNVAFEEIESVLNRLA